MRPILCRIVASFARPPLEIDTKSGHGLAHTSYTQGQSVTSEQLNKWHKNVLLS